MTLGIPTFDALAAPVETPAPDGYALYHKAEARAYIKARNEYIAFVNKTVTRSDMTAEMKIATLALHTGKGLK